ncbi:NAD-dependent epimerase/dehydratase family protein [Streptomyces sparsus]
MTTSPQVLVTGATGAVGGELVRRLTDAGCAVDGVSSRGGPGPDQVAWRMGAEPPPPRLRRHWDAVVNCAADTRWNRSPEAAEQANVGPARELLRLLADRTHLVQMSTSFACGLRGDGQSADPADYRNTYEWSKACTERLVRAEHPATDVVRFPAVLGRHGDGHIDRFSGFYWVSAGLCSGSLPALVAHRDAYVEGVAVDDLAAWTTRLIMDGPPTSPRTFVLGRGAHAPRVGEVFDLMLTALNAWRARNGASPLPAPPFVTPQAWNRFYFPFAREHLSRAQLRRVELYAAFQPYWAIEEPLPFTDLMPDITDAITASYRYWAEHNRAAASAEPRAWAAA